MRIDCRNEGTFRHQKHNIDERRGAGLCDERNARTASTGEALKNRDASSAL